MAFLEKVISIGISDTIIYTCPVTVAGSMHGLVFSNITGIDALLTIKLFSQESGVTTQVTGNITIKANEQFTWPKPINMVAGDRIIAVAGTVSAITAIASVYISTSNPISVGFTPRGAWLDSSAYVINDIVALNGSSYVAISNNVSSSPPSSSWVMFAQKGDTGFTSRGLWNVSTMYFPYDVVSSPITHHLYITELQNIGYEPSSNSLKWALLLENDSVSTAQVYATSAAASSSSASTLAASALSYSTAAATSATAASNAAATATSYSASASVAAANADTSASAAFSSETAAATSATNAATSATNAAGSATTATTKAGEADTSATTAQNWAAQLVTPVSGGEYSAKYWAQQAAASITGSLVYRGSWSAATAAYPSTPATGDYYKVSVAGTTNAIVYDVNDSIIYNGTSWDKIDSTDSVASVSGKVGAVTLVKADVGLANVDNTSDTDKPISTLQQTALNSKQAALTSGTNIKTVNGGSLLGSGDLEIVGGLAPTIVKTSSYTALVNDLVLTNSTAAGFTVILPSTPVEGDKVGLLDTTNTCSVNPVILVAAGGKTIEGDPTSLSISISGAYIELLYTGTNWKLLDTPVRQDFQETLVSGTSIKTIGGQSLLGSGDIAVSGGSSSGYEQTFLMMGA